MTELCAKHGVSRKTGYKWIARYDQEGRPGLKDRSRAPHRVPHATADDLVELIVSARKRWPKWGPRKLKLVLEKDYPDVVIPAASTIGSILKRHGLVLPPKREKKTPPYPNELAEYERPNKIWCADFKGPIPLRRNAKCCPLTISDGFSRYLIRCEVTSRLDFDSVKPVFESAFREFGLPEMIRTDNGPPFASRAPGGLSRLSIWWLKLRITPERIRPGKPTQNGRHERIHRTLQLETVAPPRKSRSAQQRLFDQFRRDYNDVRPHEGLGNACPAEFYERSGRRYPCPLREPQYSAAYETRRVRKSGEVKWRGEKYFLSETLGREQVGLRWRDELDGWSLEYGEIYLGCITPAGRFIRPKRRK